MIRILGVDCGSLQAGLAVLDTYATDPWVVRCASVIRFQRRYTFSDRITQLYDTVAEALELWKPSAVAVEDIRFNSGAPNLSSMGKTSMAIGAALVAVAKAGYTPVQQTATTVRSCFKARTKDKLRQALNIRFASDLKELGYPDGVPPAHIDATDALGLCYAAYVVCVNDTSYIHRPDHDA